MPDRPPSTETATQIDREDVRALADAYAKAGRAVERGGMIGVVGGFATGAGLLLLRGTMGLPAWLDPVFFFAGFSVAVAFAVVAWSRQRTALRRYHLQCHGCGAGVLTARPWRAEVSRAQIVASTGRCPSCGERVVHDSGGSAPRL